MNPYGLEFFIPRAGFGKMGFFPLFIPEFGPRDDQGPPGAPQDLRG